MRKDCFQKIQSNTCKIVAQNPVILRGSEEDRRNEISPIKGIETSKLFCLVPLQVLVEMEEARQRALKLIVLVIEITATISRNGRNPAEGTET